MSTPHTPEPEESVCGCGRVGPNPCWVCASLPGYEPKRTAKAIRECAEWLAACVRLGWEKEALDDLEAIWWQHHNHRGQLVASGGNQVATESSGGNRGSAAQKDSGMADPEATITALREALKYAVNNPEFDSELFDAKARAALKLAGEK